MILHHLLHTRCHYTAAPEPIFFPGEFGPEMDATLDAVRSRVRRKRDELSDDVASTRPSLTDSFGLIDLNNGSSNDFGITIDPSSGFASGGGDFGGAGGGSDW